MPPAWRIGIEPHHPPTRRVAAQPQASGLRHSRFSRVTVCGASGNVVGMTTAEAMRLLEEFRAGGVGRDEVVRAFQIAPLADLGFAQVDTHRALRKGFPEVIFGAGKTPAQVVKIAAKLGEHEQRVLVTRLLPEHALALRRKFRHTVYHELARCVTIDKKPLPKRPGTIAVICAGTSDLPMAKEAAVMILTDDNFATIIRAVENGRALYDNLMKYIRFQMGSLFAFILTFLGAALFNVLAGIPFEPLQVPMDPDLWWRIDGDVQVRAFQFDRLLQQFR